MYAHAVGHLSYLAKPAEAQRLLESIIKTSDDPEYKGSLAMVLESNKEGAGKALLAEAKSGYDALMAKHPLAFADHAGLVLSERRR